jgi:hypothetical protein
VKPVELAYHKSTPYSVHSFESLELQVRGSEGSTFIIILSGTCYRATCEAQVPLDLPFSLPRWRG